ncbi:MAG: histidine kinase [Actinobacteria bacterium]|nr:histidine kinase [Actinomycetota bacterium]MCA1739998.1 histidine kinase [Actinomycetota bacterium]
MSGFVRIFVGISHNLALEVTRSREEAAIVVERQRIAREMHDSVAQALFYLAVKLREVVHW